MLIRVYLWSAITIIILRIGYVGLSSLMDESECDRLERRCRVVMQRGNDFASALTCQMGVAYRLVKSSKEKEVVCYKVSELLDDYAAKKR